MSILNCPSCKKESNTSNICLNCNYPFNGTNEEKSKHIAEFILKKNIITDSERLIEKSQNMLYIIIALCIFPIIILWYNNLLFTVVSFLYAFLAVIFLISSILIKKYPFPVILSSLFAFIIVGFFIPSGIILRLIIIFILIYTLFLIYKSNKFKKRYM